MGLALAVEMGQGSRAGVGCWGFACGVLAHGQHNQLVSSRSRRRSTTKNEKTGLCALLPEGGALRCMGSRVVIVAIATQPMQARGIIRLERSCDMVSGNGSDLIWTGLGLCGV